MTKGRTVPPQPPAPDVNPLAHALLNRVRTILPRRERTAYEAYLVARLRGDPVLPRAAWPDAVRRADAILAADPVAKPILGKLRNIGGL